MANLSPSLTKDLETVAFTPQTEARAEQFVRDLVGATISELTARSSPTAVYLIGSFGRGEGTVLFDDDGDPRLWRDLDLVAVYRFKEDPETLGAVQDALNSSEGVNPGETPIKGSYVSIAQLPLPVARRWRDLKMYELATNSTHLYGADVRPDMAVRDGEIPRESGERFLLQKCMGLCKAYPYVEGDPATANYEVAKTYIEISSALALSLGEPSADFRARVETLGRADDEVVDDMLPRIERWGRYKVDGEFEALEDLPAREAWIQARDDLLATLGRFHDREGDPLAGETEPWLRSYYEDLSSRFLSRTFASAVAPGWPPGPLTGTLGTLGSLAYRAYGTYAVARRRAGLLTCPLSAVYVASIAGLACLENDDQDVPLSTLVRPYLEMAGEDLTAGEPEAWIRDLDAAYQRAAKPLYGMG